MRLAVPFAITAHQQWLSHAHIAYTEANQRIFQNSEEILTAYDQSMRDGEQFLQSLTQEKASAKWHLLKKDRELFSRPRIEVVRTIMLNHWYHHRGQLSVYLRLLNVPVPVIYGRSADEDPFA